MKAVKLLFLFSLVILTAIPLTAQNRIVVNLETVANPWADVMLGEKLDFYMATEERVGMIRIDDQMRDSLGWDAHTESLGRLIEQGQKLDAEYVVDIFIDRIDLERRKVTVIPQAAFRYRVYAVLTGVMRVIDIHRARPVRIEEIKCEIKASDRWRFGDDDITDYDLHLSAYQKTILFDKLEEKAVREIYRELARLTRGTGKFVTKE